MSHTWQKFVGFFHSINSSDSSSSIRLEALEDRILYDASPLAAIAMDVGCSNDLEHDMLQQLENLEELCFEATTELPVFHEEGGDSATSEITVGQSSDEFNMARQLVVIDSRIDGAESLIADLTSGNSGIVYEVLLLTENLDGISQVSDFLEQNSNFDAIHIVAHGSDAKLQLGSSIVDASNISQYEAQLSGWTSGLGLGADILIYGCEVAESEEGQWLVDQMATITGADVAASDDLTGHADLGGDWDFEYTVGLIEANVAFSLDVQQNWHGTLQMVTVTTLDDVVDGNMSSISALLGNAGADGEISLREALTAANADGVADTIVLGSGVHTLSLGGVYGDLYINNDVEIVGAADGSTVIDATGLGERVFHADAGTTTLRNLTITGGNDTGPTGGGGLSVETGATVYVDNVMFTDNSASSRGGAIATKGTLIVTNSTIDANQSGGTGGGIRIIDGNTTLENVTISNNQAVAGGGVQVSGGSGQHTFTNVTISGNAADDGGAFRMNGGSADLTNVTITDNTGTAGVGGILQSSGGLTVYNSIIAGNDGTTFEEIDGTINSGGYNIIGDDAGDSTGGIGYGGNDSLDETGLNLGALADNGGFVQTHELLAGSAGIDDALSASAPAIDGRGYYRNDPLADVGAFERGATSNLEEDLVAHFEFEEGSGLDADDSAQGNTGNIINGGTWTADSAIGGLALDLSNDTFGNNTHVNVPDSPLYDFGTDEFTISLWYNMTTPSELVRLVGNLDPGSGNSGFSLRASTSGEFSLERSDGTGSVYGYGGGTMDGQWHQLTIVVKPDGSVAFFNDGVETTSSFTSSIVNVNSPDALKIGAFDSTEGDFEGKLDDVRLYSRALDASEASQLAAGNATFNQAPTDILVTESVSGESGLSLNEDGGNDAYLLTTDDAFLDGHNALSWEFQFSDLAVNGTEATLYSYHGTGSVGNIGIQADGTITFFGVTSANQYAQLVGIGDHTLSVTWDALSGEASIYVDGVYAESITGPTGPTIANGGAMALGQDMDSVDGNYDPNETFSGKFRDVRIFDTVRTAGEIAASYDKTLAPDEAGMIANWRFDSVGLNNTIAEHVNGNDLTISHVSEAGFTASEAEVVLHVDENAANGTAVGTVTGVDPERQALIQSLLSGNPGLIFVPETNSFMAFSSTPVDWTTAQANAAATTLNGASGFLATLENASENKQVRAAAQAAGLTGIWLGASDVNAEGEWLWYDNGVAGEQFADGTGASVDGFYTNFGALEPSGGVTENYLEMDVNANQWNDLDGAALRGYVVEYDADEVLDGVGGPEDQPLTYSIVGGNTSAFAIDAGTGEITIADSSFLDHTTQPIETLTIRVTDVEGAYYEEDFDVNVLEGDEAPFEIANNLVAGPLGDQVSITSSDLSFSDDHSSPADITFTVTLVASGSHVELASNPGVPVTSFTQADIDNGELVYVHNGVGTADQIVFDVEDGTGNTVVNQVFSLDLSNAAPVFSNLNGVASYTENGSFVLMDGDVEIYDDVMSPADDFGGAQLIFHRLGGENADDRFSKLTLSSLGFTSSTFQLFGIDKGTYAHGSNGTLTMTFDSGVTNAEVNYIMQVLTYRNLGDDPPASVDIQWTFRESSDPAAFETTGTTTVNITAINDEQSLDVNQTLTVSESSAGTVITSSYLSTSDLDNTSTELTYTITNTPTSGILLMNGAQLDVGSTFTQADINANRVYYYHDQSLSTEGDFEFSVDDGQGSTTNATFDIEINQINESPTYGIGNADGVVTSDVSIGNDYGRTIVTQPDGKILVGGTAFGEFTVARYNDDGSLDNTFGTDGVASHDLGLNETGYRVFLQDDGQILLAGDVNDELAVIRMNPNGTLDTDFGVGGVATPGLPTDANIGMGVDVQADGSILLTAPNSGAVSIARLTPAGGLDVGFGTNGLATINIGGDAFDVAVDSTGRIVVAGSVGGGAGIDLLVARFDANGNLDPTFSGDGIETFDFAGSTDRGKSVEVLADDSVLVAGYVNSGTATPAVLKFDANGVLDTTFGTGGIATSPLAGIAQDMVVQSDGKIVISGSGPDYFAARFNPDGTPDLSFGGTGTVSVPLAGYEQARGVAIDSNDRILVAGHTNESGSNQFFIARHNADGTPDTTFDSLGFLDGNPTYVENDVPVLLDAEVQIFDDELSTIDDFDGATLTIRRAGGANSNDVFSQIGLVQPLVEGGDIVVTVDVGLAQVDVDFGDVLTNSNGELVLRFSNANIPLGLTAVPNDIVNQVMQSIAYSNSSDAPASSVDLEWTFDDGNAGSQGAGGALAAVGTTTVDILSVNDSPVITGQDLTLGSVGQTDTNPAGMTVANMLATGSGDAITDEDSGALEGIAIVAGDNTNGSWQYSLDGGNIWNGMPATSTSSALLLDASAMVRFVPDGIFTGTEAIAFFAWDQTDGRSSGDSGVDTFPERMDDSGSMSSTADTAAIIVTSSNVAPDSFDSTANGNEDDASITVSISGADGDGSISGYNILSLPTNGTLYHDIGHTVPVSTGLISTTLTSVSLYFVPDGDFNGIVDFEFAAVDNDGAQDATPGTTTIDIAAINDAPVLDNSGTMTLTTVAEDSSGNAGDTVADIIASAGGDRITDVDGPAEGIAVYYTDSANGNWEYSIDGGANWLELDSVSNSQARLLDTDALIRFEPGNDFNGNASMSFAAWDQSSGNVGDTVVMATAGSTLSTGVETATIAVSAVNDAPVLDTAASLNVPTVQEDDLNPAGDTVANIIASDGIDRITDVDTNPVEGLAVYDVDDSNGTWQYSLDSGGSWASFGAVTKSSATLLDPTAMIRFIPNADFDGTAKFFYHAWDQTQGTRGQTGFDIDANGVGGTSAFSALTDDATVNINPSNDAPTVTENGGTVNEGTYATMTPAMIQGGDVDDGPAGLTYSISNITNGQFEVSGVPGTAITSFTQADVDAGQIVFLHDGSETTTASFDFSLADGGENGAAPATGTFNFTVTPVNDAPVLAGTLFNFDDVSANDTNPPGSSVTDMLASLATNSVTDDDIGAVEGIAVSGVDNTNGDWQFSTTGGSTWVSFGVVNSNNATLLHDDSLVRFVPNPGYSGTAGQLTFMAWDQTGGYFDGQQNVAIAGQTGGTNPFSLTQSVADLNVTNVNDGPESISTTSGGTEDTTLGFAITGTDPDGTVASFRIVNLPINGTLYSDAGLTTQVTNNSVLTAGPGGALNLWFEPTSDWSGTTFLDFAAIDDLGLEDATAATKTLNFAAVNDAPDGTDNTIILVEDGVHALVPGSFGLTDIESHAFQSVIITNVPTVGTLELNGVTVTSGQEITAAEMTDLRYVAAPDVYGAGIDNFTFQVRDVGGTANGGVDLDPTPNTVTVNINAYNDAPVVATNTGASTTIGGSVTITTAMLNEGDVDDDGAELTYTVTGTSNGQIELSTNPGTPYNGTFTQADIDAGLIVFAHDGSSGAAGSFDFELADGGENGSVPVTGTFQVTIGGATSDSYSTDEESAISIDAANGLLSNDGSGGAATVNGNVVVGFDASQDSGDSSEWNSNTGSVNLDAEPGVTLTNSPTNPPTGITHAFELDGSGGFTSNALDLYPEIDATQSATLETWLRLDSLSGTQVIFDSGESGGQGGVTLAMQGNRLYLHIEGGGGFSKTEWFQGPVSANTWHHFAVTIDMDAGTPTVEVWVDGSQYHSQQLNQLSNWGGSWFGLGTNALSSPGNYTGSVSGEIAHFRVHDEVLNSSDINANYAQPGGGAAATPFVAGFDDNATLGNVTVNADGSFDYDPNGQFEHLAVGETAIDTFTYTYDDGLGNQETVNVTMTINGVNDAPVLNNAGANTLTSIDEDDINSAGDTVASVIGSSITDLDSGAAEGIAVYSTDTANGVWEYSTDGTNWIDFGNPTSTAALLLSDTALVRFVPDLDFNGTAQFSYKAWDQTTGIEGGTLTMTTNSGDSETLSVGIDTATIAVNPVNDAPAIDLDWDDSNGPNGINYETAFAAGDAAVPLTDGALLNDVDGTLISLRVEITNIADGAEEVLSWTSNPNIIEAYNASTGVLLLTNGGLATNAEMQAVLNSITYQNQSTTPDTLDRLVTFTVNETEPDSVVATTTIEMTGDVTAPTAFNNSGITVDEGAQWNLDPLELAFTDDLQPSSAITYTITTGPGSGYLASVGDTSTPITSFTQQDIDLGGLVYVHDGSETTSDSFTFTVDDGQGNSLTGQVFNITVLPQNDAPVLDIPTGTQTVSEDSVLTFEAANGNGISISDADAGSAVVQATLMSTNGTLTLGQTTGLSFTVGNGMINSTMTFEGSLADINAALEGLTYAPNANFNGTASLVVLTNDLGNTGAGGNETDLETIDINVDSVNDAPSTGTANASGSEDAVFVQFTVGGNDVDGAITDFRVDSLPANGDLYADSARTIPVVIGVDYPATANQAQFYFVPDANWNGTTTFEISAKDELGAYDPTPATTTITIDPVNDAPVLDNTGAMTLADINEDDVNSAGTTVGDIIGSVSGDRITDVDLGADEGIALHSVDNSNGTWQYKVLSGDAWSDVPVLPSGDALLLTSDSLLRFVPDANYNGSAGDISFRAWDQTGANNAGDVVTVTGVGGAMPFSLNTETASLDVVAVNDAPVTAATIAVGPEDTTLQIVLSGSDIDGAVTNFTLNNLPANGQLYTDSGQTILATTGVDYAATGEALTLYFIPDSNWNGTTTFDYVAKDDLNMSDATPDTATLTIEAHNDAPVNNLPATQSIPEDNVLILSVATGNHISINDVDSGTLPIQVTLTATNGVLDLAATAGLIVSGDGSATVTLEGPNSNIFAALDGLQFTPDANYTGPATITVNSNDMGNAGFGGALTDSDVLNINVTPVNDAPFNNGSPVTDLTLIEDVPGNVDLSALDLSDLDDFGGPMTLTLSTATGGQLSANSGVPVGGSGQVTVSGSGSTTITLTGTLDDLNAYLDGSLISYLHGTAHTNGVGADSIQIQLNDNGNTGAGGGNDVFLQDVGVNITAVNDVPVANDDGSFNLNEGATFTMALPGLLGNDTDVDFDALTATLITTPANGIVSLNPDGSFSYTHDGSETTTDQFTYQVNDGFGGTDTATVNFTITPVNDAPVITSPPNFAVDENDDFVGFANATDVDSNGISFSLGGNDAALFDIDSTTGEIAFKDSPDFETPLDADGNNQYEVDLIATDSDLAVTSQPILIQVNNVNESPTSITPTAPWLIENINTTGGVPVANLVTTDPDTGDSFTYTIEPQVGTDFANFSIVGDQLLFGDGVVDFENKNSYQVSVRTTDAGGLTHVETITLGITNLDEPPEIVNNDAANLDEGGDVTISSSELSATDPEDPMSAITFNLTSLPNNGILYLNGTPLAQGDSFTQADINSGTLTYIHDGGETIADSFEFDVSDQQGNSLQAQTFNLDVNPINDAPVAGNETFTTAEDSILNDAIDLIGNASDAEGDQLGTNLVSGPTNAASFTLNADGTFNYVPAANFNGTDSFTYEVFDGNGGVTTASATVNVSAVNDVPIGTTDSYSILTTSALAPTLSLLANDVDVEGDPLSAILVSGPSSGILNFAPDGTFIYIPDPGFFGTDSFSYIPNDGSASGVATLVEIEVLTVPSEGTQQGITPETDLEDSIPLIESPAETPAKPTPENDPVPPNLADVGEGRAETKVRVVNLTEAINPTGEDLDAEEVIGDRDLAASVLHRMLAARSSNLDEGFEDFELQNFGAAYDANQLWRGLDELEKESGFFADFNFAVGAITSLGALGYVVWSLRGGVLLATALTQLPTWKMIDPLPILDNYSIDENEEVADDINQYFD